MLVCLEMEDLSDSGESPTYECCRKGTT